MLPMMGSALGPGGSFAGASNQRPSTSIAKERVTRARIVCMMSARTIRELVLGNDARKAEQDGVDIGYAVWSKVPFPTCLTIRPCCLHVVDRIRDVCKL